MAEFFRVVWQLIATGAAALAAWWASDKVYSFVYAAFMG